MPSDEPESDVQAVHDLSMALRNEGYSVGLDSSDYVEDFDEHAAEAQDLLDVDDLGGFFVISHRQGQTDYATSVVVDDNVAWGLVQIEMLGAHFRTVLQALPVDTSDLVNAMVDEALTIEDMDGGPGE